MREMKICIPLTGMGPDRMKEQAEKASALPCDLVEIRADCMMKKYFLDIRTVKELIDDIKSMTGLPVIYTLRTAAEGGLASDISRRDYLAYIRSVAEETRADIIDIEGFDGDNEFEPDRISLLCGIVRECGCVPLVSSHDLEGTPPVEDMVRKFCAMEKMDGDILKLAVTAKTAEDTYALLEAARLFSENYATRPIIAIAMGEAGKESRVCGGDFGSVITFAAGVNATAPGQMPASELRQAIEKYNAGK